jgi:hypothetical protein
MWMLTSSFLFQASIQLFFTICSKGILFPTEFLWWLLKNNYLIITHSLISWLLILFPWSFTTALCSKFQNQMIVVNMLQLLFLFSPSPLSLITYIHIYICMFMYLCICIHMCMLVHVTLIIWIIYYIVFSQ